MKWFLVNAKIALIKGCQCTDYQELNIDIVKFIVENHLVDFQHFIKAIKLIPCL